MGIYLLIVSRCDESPVSWSLLKQRYACALPICAAAALLNSTATKWPNVSVTKIILVFSPLTGRCTVLWADLRRWACFRVSGKTRRFPPARIVRVAAYTCSLRQARPPLRKRARPHARGNQREPRAARCPHELARDAARDQL